MQRYDDLLPTQNHFRRLPPRLSTNKPKHHFSRYKHTDFIMICSDDYIKTDVHSIYPIIHLLPGTNEMSLDVIAQQMKVSTAMQGMANHTGMRGWAWSPATKTVAMLLRKKRCIRYMPKDNFDRLVIHRGACWRMMHVKSRKAPKEAQSTLGVQNSHDHSSIGVSMRLPGTPAFQNDHPVKRDPMRRHKEPTRSFLVRLQVRWCLI